MITFAHQTADCKGSLMEVGLVTPNGGGAGGGFEFRIRRQTVAAEFREDGTRARPEFCGDAVSCFVSVNQAAHVLSVLEGRASGVCGGKGAFCPGDGGGGVSVLHCDRTEEASGRFYAFHIIQRPQGGASRDGRISLNASEAMALARAINSAMGAAAFADGRGAR